MRLFDHASLDYISSVLPIISHGMSYKSFMTDIGFKPVYPNYNTSALAIRTHGLT